jgi:hypothetical protein
MQNYSARVLDDEGHVYDRRKFQASDHREALNVASQCSEGQAIEIWTDSGFVQTISPSHGRRTETGNGDASTR